MVTVKIDRCDVRLDPSIAVFNVSLQNHDKTGIWKETFGSEELLRAFLMGVEALAGLRGIKVKIPEIPKQPTMSSVYISND